MGIFFERRTRVGITLGSPAPREMMDYLEGLGRLDDQFISTDSRYVEVTIVGPSLPVGEILKDLNRFQDVEYVSEVER